MAFSGQYAAAQLHKLDGLLPCHFALAKEVAKYLGLPPTLCRRRTLPVRERSGAFPACGAVGTKSLSTCTSTS